MVFITAEIGINHNGDIEIAKKLIDVAKESGCDAVKFQKRTVEKVYAKETLDAPRDSPWGKTTRDQKLGLEFNKKEYDIIDDYCNNKGIEWYASAWDIDSQLFLQQYNLKHNKVASAMLVHHELLEKIAEEGKHTFVSTGMSTMEDIEKAVKILKLWHKGKKAKELASKFGVSTAQVYMITSGRQWKSAQKIFNVSK